MLDSSGSQPPLDFGRLAGGIPIGLEHLGEARDGRLRYRALGGSSRGIGSRPGQLPLVHEIESLGPADDVPPVYALAQHTQYPCDVSEVLVRPAHLEVLELLDDYILWRGKPDLLPARDAHLPRAGEPGPIDSLREDTMKSSLNPEEGCSTLN